MHKIKLAVIGVGHVGIKHVRSYTQLNNVDLVSICDLDLTKANLVAEEFNIASVTHDYKKLLDKKIDAVSICVPTILHYKIAKDFLEAGINVLVEKPFTQNLIEAQKLVKLTHKKQLILQVGHVERFNSAFAAIKDSIVEPKFIECHRLNPFPNRSLDIGVVLDLMIHDIDIVLGLVKSKITKVEAVGTKVLTEKEDIANARITFANGCVCNLTASRISDEPMRKIRIFLKDTYISLDYVKQEAYFYKKVGANITKDLLPIEREEPLKKELESFLDCVTHKKTPLVSGQEGYRALSLALKIQNKIWR
ncbi:MAG: Gfo/Idh/MocA family oxidoreductase [Candidatus Omnitrophota bacterium]